MIDGNLIGDDLPEVGRQPQCSCESCNAGDKWKRMSLCPRCGNKRCPKASHHAHRCNHSNETGQHGSTWGDWKIGMEPFPDILETPADALRFDWQPSEAEPLPPRGQHFIRNYQWLMYACAKLRHMAGVDDVRVTPAEMGQLKGEPTLLVPSADGGFSARWES